MQILLEDSPEILPAVLNFPVYDLDVVFKQKMELVSGQSVHKLLVYNLRLFILFVLLEHKCCK